MRRIKFVVGMFLLPFLSCSSNDEEVLLHTNGKAQAPVETELIELSLELSPSSQAEEVLRFTHNTAVSDDVREDGHPYSVRLNESDIEVRLAFRKASGNGYYTPQYNKFVFTKVRGQNRYLLQTKVLVPLGYRPDEVSGFVVNERNARFPNTVYRTFLNDLDENTLEFKPQDKLIPEVSEGAPAHLNMPYQLHWQPLAKNGARTRLVFKPSGIVIRYRLTNSTKETLQLNALRYKSDRMFFDWKYKLEVLNSYLYANMMNGYRENISTPEDQTFSFSQENILPGKSSKWYYMCVMPTAGATSGTTSFHPWIRRANGTSRWEAMILNGVPTKAGSVYVDHDITMGSNIGGAVEGS